MTRPAYMDHHSTTPLEPRVLEAMMPWLTERFGNAASRSHAVGWEAEEAVERALGLNNLDLALANAERPGSVARGEVPVGGDEESEELRKRLWLRIARHVVTEKDDIRAAINLMSQSEGLLKIEDILPFFPGFARIDDFKDEIYLEKRMDDIEG